MFYVVYLFQIYLFDCARKRNWKNKFIFNCSNFASLQHSGDIIDKSWIVRALAGWFVIPSQDSSFSCLNVLLPSKLALCYMEELSITWRLKKLDSIGRELHQERSLKTAWKGWPGKFLRKFLSIYFCIYFFLRSHKDVYIYMKIYICVMQEIIQIKNDANNPTITITLFFASWPPSSFFT